MLARYDASLDEARSEHKTSLESSVTMRRDLRPRKEDYVDIIGTLPIRNPSLTTIEKDMYFARDIQHFRYLKLWEAYDSWLVAHFLCEPDAQFKSDTQEDWFGSHAFVSTDLIGSPIARLAWPEAARQALESQVCRCWTSLVGCNLCGSSSWSRRARWQRPRNLRTWLQWLPRHWQTVSRRRMARMSALHQAMMRRRHQRRMIHKRVKRVLGIGAKVLCSSCTKKWDQLAGTVCCGCKTWSAVRLCQAMDGMKVKDYGNSSIEIVRCAPAAASSVDSEPPNRQKNRCTSALWWQEHLRFRTWSRGSVVVFLGFCSQSSAWREA